METAHGNNKRHKETSGEAVKTKPPDVLLGKFEDVFTRIGAIGAGIAFVLGILVWLVLALPRFGGQVLGECIETWVF